jgi:hypothetical protein
MIVSEVRDDCSNVNAEWKNYVKYRTKYNFFFVNSALPSNTPSRKNTLPLHKRWTKRCQKVKVVSLNVYNEYNPSCSNNEEYKLIQSRFSKPSHFC